MNNPRPALLSAGWNRGLQIQHGCNLSHAYVVYRFLLSSDDFRASNQEDVSASIYAERKYFTPVAWRFTREEVV